MPSRSRLIRAALIVPAIAGVIALAACSSNSTSSSSDSSSSKSSTADIGTATAGTITLGADFTAIPNQLIVNGEKQGFDVDLCNGIAKELGVKIKWVNLGFDSLIPGLQAKRFDGLCTAVNITSAREQIMNMVPYTQWGVSMFTLNKNASDYSSSKTGDYAEFAGKTVAVPSGGSEVLALQTANKSLSNPMKIVQFATNQEVYQAVTNGTADAGFVDDPQLAYYNKNNSSPFTDIFKGANPNPVGLATLKSNTKLADAFVKGLKAMKADGTYASIIKKWNLESVSDFSINPTPSS